MRSGGDNLSVWELKFEVAYLLNWHTRTFCKPTVVVYVSVIYCLFFYSSIVTRVVRILLLLLYICNFFAITVSFNPTNLIQLTPSSCLAIFYVIAFVSYMQW